MKTVVVINQASMGHGDEELGRRILQTMLSKARAFRQLQAIVFYNSAVHLLTAGSAMLPALAALESGGVDLVACGTCVDYFGIREQIKVGEVGSMDGILALLENAEKVVTL